MLICLLTTLIAPSSHLALQSQDAFQKDEEGIERGEAVFEFLSFFFFALDPSDISTSYTLEQVAY